jgi:NDP-sugar pyrophosphorylase family protein
LGTSRLSDLLSRVVAAGHPVRMVYSRGGWVNVNDLRDLLDASGLSV